MRNILFRAKPLRRNKNGTLAGREKNWISGGLITEKAYVDGAWEDHTFIHTKSDWGSYYTMAAVDPETVCQYAGMDHVSGKQIFEGDIFRCGPDFFGFVYGIVKFGMYGGKHQGFYVDWLGRASGFRNDLRFWAENPEAEIIGDIFNEEVMDMVTKEVTKIETDTISGKGG